MLATTAPTDLPFCALSWYVSYPMTMVSLRGILTAQGSPPSLEFIWMASVVPNDHGVLEGNLDSPGLTPQLGVHLDGNLGGDGHKALGLAEHGAGDALAGDGLLQATLLLHGSVVVTLVVGDDDHDNGGLHVNDLVQLLDVGGGSVVGQHEYLRGAHRHPQGRGNLLERVHKLLGHSLIPVAEDHGPLLAVPDTEAVPLPKGSAPVCIVQLVGGLAGPRCPVAEDH